MHRAERHDSPHSTLFTPQDRVDAAAHARRLESTNPERDESDTDFATIQLDEKHESGLISQEDIDRTLFGEIEEGPKREELKILVETTSTHEIISVIDSQTGNIILIKEVATGSIDNSGYDELCEDLITMALDVALEFWRAEQTEKAAFEASYTSSLATRALGRTTKRRKSCTSTEGLIAANADPWGR